MFRVTVGIDNLARAKSVTASSTSKHGGLADAAVDGDPNTMWWSGIRGTDCQSVLLFLQLEGQHVAIFDGRIAQGSPSDSVATAIMSIVSVRSNRPTPWTMHFDAAGARSWS